VDNGVHTLQEVDLSGIPAMPFSLALKNYATLKSNEINVININGQ
jgi:hypothetical protein